MPNPSSAARSEERSSGPPEEAAAVVPLSDRVLLERHARGDAGAFAQLMKTYANPIYGYLVRSGIRPADRDDLFQQVFEKVHRASQRQLPDGAVRPWLFAIAANTVRDAYRRAKVRSIVELDEAPGAQEPSLEAGPDERAERAQELSFLDREIAKLPIDQREALLLCAVEGLAAKDAAEALGVPVNTVKTRVRRARLALAAAAQRRQTIEAREGA